MKQVRNYDYCNGKTGKIIDIESKHNVLQETIFGTNNFTGSYVEDDRNNGDGLDFMCLSYLNFNPVVYGYKLNVRFQVEGAL